MRSEARQLEDLRRAQEFIDPNQTYFVQPVAVQASPDGQNVFVFEQGRPLSLMSNLSNYATDAMSILEGLVQVMQGLSLLHNRWGSHNNLTVNTVSAKEPPNDGMPNVKVQLIENSFFAQSWPEDWQALQQSYFRRASQKIGRQSVLPMLALYRQLDEGTVGLEDYLVRAEEKIRYRSNGSRWSLDTEEPLLWTTAQCMQAIRHLQDLQSKDPEMASEAIRQALSFGDVFLFYRLCLEWIPMVLGQVSQNTSLNILDLDFLHSQFKEFFVSMQKYTHDELVFTRIRHAPWTSWISQWISIFSHYTFTM